MHQILGSPYICIPVQFTDLLVWKVIMSYRHCSRTHVLQMEESQGNRMPKLKKDIMRDYNSIHGTMFNCL